MGGLECKRNGGFSLHVNAVGPSSLRASVRRQWNLAPYSVFTFLIKTTPDTSRLRTSSRAFTLTELLVVIATVAVLAAILLPVLARSKIRARRIQCMGNLRQLGISLHGFLTDHQVYPVYRNYDYVAGRYDEHGRNWIQALDGSGLDAKGVWQCPSAQFPPNHPAFSYGYNVWGSSGAPALRDLGLGGHTVPMHGSSAPSLAPPIDESEIVNPSEMMAIGDSYYGGDIFCRLTGSGSNYARFLQFAASRHSKLLNVLFCDGHVGSPTLTWLFSGKNELALANWNRDHQPHREQLP